MLDLLGPVHLVGRMEEDIHQKEEDNDLSCLVVPVAFDCFQLGDSVRNLDQEDHILDVKVAVYRLVLHQMGDSYCSLGLQVEAQEEEGLKDHWVHILVH
jgi:hypothetical protein